MRPARAWGCAALAAIAAATTVSAWAEVEHWRASRRGFGTAGRFADGDSGNDSDSDSDGDRNNDSDSDSDNHRGVGRAGAGPGSREAVVVLGVRNRGSRANYLNRWRVRAGIRSQQAPASRLVLCGGPTASVIPESMLMAAYARHGCRYAGELLVETESVSTWENIRNAIQLIEDADRIKIVSNSLHAEKARIYLRMQRPDLADRLVPAADYRFGELLLLKPALAIVGLRKLRSLAAQRGADRS